VQEQQLDSEEVNTARQERAAQVIKDLSEEIHRMKAAEQRKTDAYTTLAHLLSTVKQVTEQITLVRLASCLEPQPSRPLQDIV
jgi:DNA replication initiation complex subunit (GINS family)